MLHTRVALNRFANRSHGLPLILQLHARTAFKVQQLQLQQRQQQQCFSVLTKRGTTARSFFVETQCRYCSAGGTTTGVVNNEQKQANDEGILKRVLTKVGIKPNSKTRLKVTSHMLYESVADRINYLDFFREFKMPNTFNSWFLVTELHVWMMLVRAMAEGAESGENGRFLRNCIVEAMWADVNTRAKKLGAHNPSMTRKQIEILSEQFQAALIAYDEGAMSNDRILAASLWRRFFEKNCDDYENIERLVKYVRKQLVMLDQMSPEAFLNKPKILWLNLDKVHI